MEFFEDADCIFFVGIGGIGISGLARLFAAHEKVVKGSDLTASALTEDMIEEGIDVRIGHAALPEGVNLVIYSEAIPKDNPELASAKMRGIKMMTYFEALGEVAESYRLVAIAGTHGKTTTTAMLALILINAGLDPTVLVGSKLKEFGNRNMRIGGGDIFLVEACEYRRNFKNLKPALLGILNIELDHVDYFESFEDYKSAFDELADRSDEVIWPDDYSEFDGDLAVPGWHNRSNAGMAAMIARRLGVDGGVINSTLAEFAGTWRRFEYRGEAGGALIYDDYAHHPTEIEATLDAAREKHPEARIIAVFQPHQYSRVVKFKDELAEAFGEADKVIIPNIYEARDTEEDKNAVNVQDLVDAIAEHHDDVSFGEGLENTAKILLDELVIGDLVLVMGAGDVTHIIPMITGESIGT